MRFKFFEVTRICSVRPLVGKEKVNRAVLAGRKKDVVDKVVENKEHKAEWQRDYRIKKTLKPIAGGADTDVFGNQSPNPMGPGWIIRNN